MRESFIGLIGGLLFAILLVYLLIVVNFQSWLDPFIIITALASGVSGHSPDAFPDSHDAQRPGDDGRHHVHGCSYGQQHPCGEFRERPLLESGDAVVQPWCRIHPFSPGHYDCFGDDHRHGSDGPGHGRGWRTKCSAGASSYWRPDPRNPRYVELSSPGLRISPWPGRVPRRGWNFGSMSTQPNNRFRAGRSILRIPPSLPRS